MSLYLGRKPYVPDHRDLLFRDVKPKISLPNVPKPHGGRGLDFGFHNWLMLGNGPDDTVFPGFGGAGDCFWAGQAHGVMQSHFDAGTPVPAFSGKTVIEANYAPYVAQSNNGQGYDPKTGANDTGTDPRTGLQIIQNTGLIDDTGTAHKIGTYLLLDPENPQEWWEALWLCDQIGAGINFPQSAMDQFNADNTMWTWQSASPIEGGHWFLVPGHPIEGVWTGVTWASRQTMTEQFLVRTAEEMRCWIDPERYSTVTGKDYDGWSNADLEAYFAILAQQYSQQ